MSGPFFNHLFELEWQWPWTLWLLPVPLLVYWLTPAVRLMNSAALKLPMGLGGFDTQQTMKSRQVSRSLFLLAWLAWACLLAALARPEWVGPPVKQSISGRDLMLAVDLSGSMKEQDFVVGNQTINRLQALKVVATDFIERRQGDRIGLILFGDQAYIQAPLTFDLTTVNTLLLEAAIGLAGESTAIGDAIGLAIKRLQDSTETDKVLILLTDGANTSGEIEPLKAAELAAAEGLKIYTIGIGADSLMRRSQGFFMRSNPSRDLDEPTLREIADLTNGQYFRARNTEELQEIYGLLDQLEPVEQDIESFRPTMSLYHWPLSIALGLFGLTVLAWRLRRGYA